MEFPDIPETKPWANRELLPAKPDWEAVIARAVEAGKDVPEVLWAAPGEVRALRLAHTPGAGGATWDPNKPLDGFYSCTVAVQEAASAVG